MIRPRTRLHTGSLHDTSCQASSLLTYADSPASPVAIRCYARATVSPVHGSQMMRALPDPKILRARLPAVTADRDRGLVPTGQVNVYVSCLTPSLVLFMVEEADEDDLQQIRASLEEQIEEHRAALLELGHLAPSADLQQVSGQRLDTAHRRAICSHTDSCNCRCRTSCSKQ